MKKRVSKDNEVLNLVITPLGGLSTEELLSYDYITSLVRRELPKGIERAIKNRKADATIIEINHSGYFIEIPIRFWRNALNSCLEYYTEEEDYTKCIYIKSVLDKVAEYEKIPSTLRTRKSKREKK